MVIPYSSAWLNSQSTRVQKVLFSPVAGSPPEVNGATPSQVAPDSFTPSQLGPSSTSSMQTVTPCADRADMKLVMSPCQVEPPDPFHSPARTSSAHVSAATHSF